MRFLPGFGVRVGREAFVMADTGEEDGSLDGRVVWSSKLNVCCSES